MEHENASGSARSDVEVVHCTVLYCVLYCTVLYFTGGAGEAEPRPGARVQGHQQGAQGKTNFE